VVVGLPTVSNKKMNKLILFFFLAAVILTSCKGDDEEFDAGYKYYPLTVGDYKIYQVKKISFQPNDTTYENFEIKELVSEEFTINGEKRFKLEIFKRLDNSLPWPETPDSVWSTVLSESKVIKIENNVRYIKLVFPIKNARTWDGNSENFLEADDYVFKDINRPYTVLYQNFPITATVLQSPNDSSTRLYKDYRAEIYAEKVGLVYKLIERYDYKQTGGVANFDFKIDVGVKHYERLTSYGHQ
jgi:hypothetical protein